MSTAQDITTFFTKSTRGENDKANKTRETKVLKVIDSPPNEFLDHPEYGKQWRTVHEAWTAALKKIAEQQGISVYTETKTKLKGGRKFNYDADVLYYNGTELVATKKIEFKYGASKIGDLPQFLSLQAKIPLFPVTYDRYFYENYLDQYIACDSAGITQPKPSLEAYVKAVTSTKYTITPFFQQLKEREEQSKEAKNEVVNRSIRDYLTTYGSQIDLAAFTEKVKSTQDGKIYLLWSDGVFHVDQINQGEMASPEFHSIKNGNVLELKSGEMIYGLLLRWRNHKGILNPAWQITCKRATAAAATAGPV